MLHAELSFNAAQLPIVSMAGLWDTFCAHPVFGVNPLARYLQAVFEFASNAAPTHTRPPFRISETMMRGREVTVTEQVHLRGPFCDLVQFRKETTQKQPRVLVVVPMSGHFATLLRPTVTGLLPNHDVYVTDWRSARDVPLSAGSFGLAEQIDVIMGYLRHLGPDTHVVAVSQSVVPILVAVARLAEDNDPGQPKTMTLIAGPIDTQENPTSVNVLVAGQPIGLFENVISCVPPPHLGVGRRVYPGITQLAALSIMNMDRHARAHGEMFHDFVWNRERAARTRAFYNEFMAVMDLPDKLYLDMLERVFQKHQIPRGTFLHEGRLMEPGAIKNTACLVVEGGRDDICPPGQTSAVFPLLSSLPEEQKCHLLVPEARHYDLIAGKHWKDGVLPNLSAFIRAHP